METLRFAKTLGETVSIFDAAHHIPDAKKEFKLLGYRVNSKRHCFMYMRYKGLTYRVITWFPTVNEYIFRVEKVKPTERTDVVSNYKYVLDYCKENAYGAIEHERKFYREDELELAKEAMKKSRGDTHIYEVY